ncbi:MAG TPA: hypothetical protein PKE69_25630 [Pyrinomonadaceae bacterium]|nr:hypothetical protein [Pyrinomonadaceae bacterium]
MKPKKITRTMEITLEQSNLRFSVTNRRKVFGDCGRCGERTRLLPPEEIADVSPRLIYCLVESRKVYFTELPDDSLLVCGECVGREKRIWIEKNI